MLKKLKNNFTHAALGTIIWVILLTSLTNLNTLVPFHFFWNVIAIGMLAGLLLGILYPLLWTYCTFSAPVNVAVSSFVSLIFQFIIVYLYSPNMLTIITPSFPGIAILTVLGHVAAFYFYRNYLNRKMVRELNQIELS